MRNTKNHANDNEVELNDREKGRHKQTRDDLLQQFTPRTAVGAAAEMLAQLCGRHFHTGLLLSFGLTE